MKHETALKIVAEIVLKYLQVNYGFDSSLYERFGFKRGEHSHKLVWRAHEALRVLGWEENGGDKIKQLNMFGENDG